MTTKTITDYKVVNCSPSRYLHYEIFNANDKRIRKKPFKFHHFAIICYEADFLKILCNEKYDSNHISFSFFNIGERKTENIIAEMEDATFMFNLSIISTNRNTRGFVAVMVCRRSLMKNRLTCGCSKIRF